VAPFSNWRRIIAESSPRGKSPASGRVPRRTDWPNTAASQPRCRRRTSGRGRPNGSRDRPRRRPRQRRRGRTPLVVPVSPVPGEVAPVQVVRSPEVPIVHQFLKVPNRRHIAVRERHQRDDAGAVCGLGRPPRLCGRHPQTLLAEDVEPTLQRRHRDRIVVSVWGGDDDGVQALRVQDLLDRGKGTRNKPGSTEADRLTT
jgi:hypothetical protein